MKFINIRELSTGTSLISLPGQFCAQVCSSVMLTANPEEKLRITRILTD
ncbi:MAG: hypothetical protein [Olavius algarvensis Gamma 1 endosymbiont]|nr:MAG: hypothetical protein [Olavius algarvensis Gamma 1 endosymbiont]